MAPLNIIPHSTDKSMADALKTGMVLFGGFCNGNSLMGIIYLIIDLLGAEFTHAYVRHSGKTIEPYKYVIKINADNPVEENTSGTWR